ncbi:MAG: hypothetical protein ABIT71_21340 [Vicinamibacteraceae bacterium]
MARTIEDLIHAEARLGRAFIGYLFAVLSGVAWPMFVASQGADLSSAWIAASLGLLMVQAGLYIWFAIAAGSAAKALGDTAWHYILWILAAPFLALVPLPLISTVIAVSPLSIKFLLGGQLQTAIRDQTSMAMHVSA